MHIGNTNVEFKLRVYLFIKVLSYAHIFLVRNRKKTGCRQNNMTPKYPCPKSW